MNYYLKIYSLFSASILLVACSSDPWSKDEKNDFLTSCKLEGVEEQKCECMMNETMNRYPRYDEAEKISFEEAVEIAELCK